MNTKVILKSISTMIAFLLASAAAFALCANSREILGGLENVLLAYVLAYVFPVAMFGLGVILVLVGAEICYKQLLGISIFSYMMNRVDNIGKRDTN